MSDPGSHIRVNKRTEELLGQLDIGAKKTVMKANPFMAQQLQFWESRHEANPRVVEAGVDSVLRVLARRIAMEEVKGKPPISDKAVFATFKSRAGEITARHI